MLRECAGSPNLAIRKQAASTILPFIPMKQWPDEVAKIAEFDFSTACNNTIHGVLLRVKEILHASNLVEDVDSAVLAQHLVKIYSRFTEHPNSGSG